MGNKKVVNSSVADRSSYNIHVIHDKKPATLDDLIEAENEMSLTRIPLGELIPNIGLLRAVPPLHLQARSACG